MFGRGRELTLEMALLRVGLGAVFFAPNRRFIFLFGSEVPARMMVMVRGIV